MSGAAWAPPRHHPNRQVRAHKQRHQSADQHRTAHRHWQSVGHQNQAPDAELYWPLDQSCAGNLASALRSGSYRQERGTHAPALQAQKRNCAQPMAPDPASADQRTDRVCEYGELHNPVAQAGPDAQEENFAAGAVPAGRRQDCPAQPAGPIPLKDLGQHAKDWRRCATDARTHPDQWADAPEPETHS